MMTQGEQAQRLHDELWKLIMYYAKEYPDIDFAQAMGILETLKLDLYRDAAEAMAAREEE